MSGVLGLVVKSAYGQKTFRLSRLVDLTFKVEDLSESVKKWKFVIIFFLSSIEWSLKICEKWCLLM